MELQHPLGAISGAVDTRVLDVLVRAADQPMDAAMIARLSGKSYTGVRHALERLVEQGTVLESSVGAKILYRFNARHLLAPAITSIVDAKRALLQRLSELIEREFTPAFPRFGALFGSAARGDMRPDSDLDLFMVRPAHVDVDAFAQGADDFAEEATALTGNDARVLVYTDRELTEGSTKHPLLAEIARDGIPLVGDLAEFRRTVLSGFADAAG
ncbi:nucleotidyltransferase domain-containing protein [Agromyces sp. PvR057]|uniref:nucleotidyltransferase domain-containing protein n=1 Tax=Agromyces sp. PvR057 TaxID=3156403 RepID=UPI003391BEFA